MSRSPGTGSGAPRLQRRPLPAAARPEPGDAPARLRGELVAGALLLRAGPAAGFAVLAICLLAAVTVPFGWWRPVVIGPLLLPLAWAVWWLVRRVPYRTGPPVPVWSSALCLALAVGFGVWAGLTHGQQIVLRRDPGSYALFAHWLATRHGLPVDADLAAFGGPAALGVPGFTLDSPGFYQVLHGSGAAIDAQIVPQFLLGAPAVYSLGVWLAGWTGLFVAPAVCGAFAVLAAGGLAARLIGPRWAPLAAAALAVSQPVLHAARGTLSEPVALLLVLVAAALAADAVDARCGPRARSLAIAAGATLGLAGLVRVDVLREVVLLIPLGVLLWVRGSRVGLPMAASALAGTAVAAVPALTLSRPYLSTVAGSLRPLLVATVAVTLLGTLLVAGYTGARFAGVPTRRRGDPAASAGERARSPVLGALPLLAGALVLLAGLALATRAWWSVDRQAGDDPGNALVASLQQQQGLVVDGARTYAEHSVQWLVWYVGPIAAAAALLVAAGCAVRAVRWWLGATSPVPGWLIPGLVGFGSALLTLYRPAITPDHPWADRRLVPVVLPATALAATMAAAWAVRQARRRMPAGLLAGTAVAAVVAVLVPPASATLPLVTSRTEVGEQAAVRALCARLHPGDVVVGVDDDRGNSRAQDEWVQVVRGVCGHPSGALLTSAATRPVALRTLAGLVEGAGGRLVLLSAGEADGSAARALTALGLTPVQAALRHTVEDQHLLTSRPSDDDSLMIDVWLAAWPVGSSG